MERQNIIPEKLHGTESLIKLKRCDSPMVISRTGFAIPVAEGN